MRRENRKKHSASNVDSRRWMSVVGFLVSITLLSFAIFLSINQEKMDKMATINEYAVSNYTLATSSEISSGVNEILSNEVMTVPIVTNELNDNNTVVTENVTENIIQESEEQVSSEEKAEEMDEQEKQEENETKQEEEKKEVNKQFIIPINGDIYKEFSMDSLVYSDTLQEWVTHRGIDIQANLEEEVKASAEGTVKSIKNDPRYGWSITIEHKDGFTTIYTCLRDANLVQEGDVVEQGQVIAKVGNSGVFESADGSHLHFEMTKDGGYINPELYL